MKYIPVIFVLLFFMVPGCLEESSYINVSSSELLTNLSTFEGKKICIDGIYDNFSVSGIMIGKVQNFSVNNEDGNFVNMCGTYKNGKLEADSVNTTLSIFTDQNIYHLNETMKVHIEFLSSRNGNGQVHVSGLKNPFYRQYINEKREIIIEKGLNQFDFEFKIPICEECSYLFPGKYTVNATVNMDGQNYETYRKFQLEKAK